MRGRFWYSENHRKWLDYVDANPLFGSKRPSHGNSYALIDGQLVAYTEMSTNPDYEGPNFDDAVFLGYGEYACNDWNLQTWLRRHPGIALKGEEWPDIVICE